MIISKSQGEKLTDKDLSAIYGGDCSSYGGCDCRASGGDKFYNAFAEMVVVFDYNYDIT